LEGKYKPKRKPQAVAEKDRGEKSRMAIEVKVLTFPVHIRKHKSTSKKEKGKQTGPR